MLSGAWPFKALVVKMSSMNIMCFLTGSQSNSYRTGVMLSHLLHTAWVKIKCPRARKILKILLTISELFFIYDINIYIVVYHQCKYHQIWPFNFRDMTPFVRVLKISLVPTYSIHHVHLKHDNVAIPTGNFNNKTSYSLLVFIYDANKHFCTQ